MTFRYPIIDLPKCVGSPPPPLDFVLPGLVAGTVGSIVAPGATGKSWLALQLAALVGAGFDSAALNFGKLETGKVLMMAAEDPQNAIWKRVNDLSSKMTPKQKQSFLENVVLANCLGRAGDLMDDGQAADEIIGFGECRLIVFDTLSRWHSGDENSRRDAVKVMRNLERIAIETGAAILFLHHTSKFAALNGQGGEQQASRGSSVWVDEARWVAFLKGASDHDKKEIGGDTKNFVKFGISKANYCPPQADIWLKRGYAGMLERATAKKYGEAKERYYDDF